MRNDDTAVEKHDEAAATQETIPPKRHEPKPKAKRPKAKKPAKKAQPSKRPAKGKKGHRKDFASRKALVIWLPTPLKNAAAKFAKAKGKSQAELFVATLKRAIGYKGK